MFLNLYFLLHKFSFINFIGSQFKVLWLAKIVENLENYVKIYFVYHLFICVPLYACLSMWVWAHEYIACGGQKRITDPVGTRVTSSYEPPTEGTGANLRPSARVASIITHLAISPNPPQRY